MPRTVTVYAYNELSPGGDYTVRRNVATHSLVASLTTTKE